MQRRCKKEDEQHWLSHPSWIAGNETRDGFVWTWVGEGTICKFLPCQLESFRSVTEKLPWRFRSLGYSDILSSHLFRRGDDRLSALIDTEAEIPEPQEGHTE